MDRLTNVKESFLVFLGGIGSVIINLMGGYDNFIYILFFFMVADMFIGTISGSKGKSTKTENGKISSNVFFKGIKKKLSMLVLVMVGYHLDLLMNIDYVRNGTIIALIVDECFSLAEHYTLLGTKVPQILLDTLEIVKKKEVKKIE